MTYPLPQLMIFDMDGLIFDTERLFMVQKAIVMARYGYAQRESDYISTLGTSGSALNRRLHQIYGPDYPADRISAETRERVAEVVAQDGPPVKPGIPKLLRWLQEHRVPCSVATATPRKHALFYLEQSGLLPYFDFVVAGDQINRAKPDPEIFLACCTRKNVSPETAMVLEDSENGILAAARAGIPVVGSPDLKIPGPAGASRALTLLNRADEVIALFD